LLLLGECPVEVLHCSISEVGVVQQLPCLQQRCRGPHIVRGRCWDRQRRHTPPPTAIVVLHRHQPLCSTDDAASQGFIAKLLIRSTPPLEHLSCIEHCGLRCNGNRTAGQCPTLQLHRRQPVRHASRSFPKR